MQNIRACSKCKWLKSHGLKAETEGLKIAAQDLAAQMRSITLILQAVQSFKLIHYKSVSDIKKKTS